MNCTYHRHMAKLSTFNKSKYLFLLLYFFFITKLNANNNILMQIKDNIQNTQNLRFDFTQKTSELIERGTCVIIFPEKMKCIYEGKEGKELYVTNKEIFIIKHRYQRKYNYRTANTAFEIILNKDILYNKINQVKNIVIKDNIIIADITDINNSLLIFFDKKTKNLKGWKMLSLDQKEILFKINNIERNIVIDQKFSIPEYD